MDDEKTEKPNIKALVIASPKDGSVPWVECTKEKPWDGKAVPIIHVDADFISDSLMVHCPNCKHTWVAKDE